MFILRRNNETLRQALNSLPDQERWAIILRYGLNGEKRMTYSEIAERLSVKTSQITPLLERGLQRIRRQEKFSEEFRDRLGDSLYPTASADGVSSMSNEEMEKAINGIIEAFNYGLTLAG